MICEFRVQRRGLYYIYIYLGVISVQVILKTMKLDEIIREWMWMEKRNVQELSPGEAQTQSSDAAIIKKQTDRQTKTLLQIPRI